MSSIKNMFAPVEDYEDERDYEDEDEDENAGWEENWEKMQESAAKEKRKLKTLKRLKASGEY